MPTLQAIKDRLKAINAPKIILWMGQRDLLPLCNTLGDDEIIEHVVPGDYEGGSGLLVATDQRVLFVDKRFLGQRVEMFAYDKIASIQVSSGMIHATITIMTSGNTAAIKKVPDVLAARRLTEYVRQRLTASKSASAPTASTPDIITQLERLAALRAQGILTEDEFQAQKQRLLSA